MKYLYNDRSGYGSVIARCSGNRKRSVGIASGIGNSIIDFYVDSFNK